MSDTLKLIIEFRNYLFITKRKRKFLDAYAKQHGGETFLFNEDYVRTLSKKVNYLNGQFPLDRSICLFLESTFVLDWRLAGDTDGWFNFFRGFRQYLEKKFGKYFFI